MPIPRPWCSSATANADSMRAAFLPTDGQVNPADITQSLAKGARMGGVTICEEVAVTGILIDKGRAVGVEYEDNEELKGADKVEKRDKKRWELDPASSEDWDER